jgi:hypothetical protein
MSRVRKSIRTRLRRSAGFFELKKRLAKVEARLARQDERLKRQNDRLHRQRELLATIKPIALRAQIAIEILGAQISAMEERLESLTEKVHTGGGRIATADEIAADRTLLEEVREEHRRIRVRFGVVTSYEERLRRVESALAEEMAAAADLARTAGLNGALANAPTHGAVDLPEEPEDALADP